MHALLRSIVTSFIFIMLLTACDNTAKYEQVTEDDQQFVYIPLNDLEIKPTILIAGTEVEILANLGGKPNKGDTVFYYQFIVRNKATNDTIRILCPEITIDPSAGIDHKTSTTPLAYNFSKGITTAYFELIDSSKSILVSGENLDKLTNGDTNDLKHVLNPANTIHMVVLDKDDTKERILRFRTAIGTLNFKQIPW